MGPPVSADRLMVVVGCCLAGVSAFAILGFPVAPDLDVLCATAILCAGLLGLLRRLGLLNLGGLGLRAGSGEGESQCES